MSMKARGVTSAQLAKQEEIDLLREENRQLRELLAPSTVVVPRAWGLTTSELRVFSHMTTREIVSRDSIMAALYSGRPGEQPNIAIITVFVTRIRRKLARYGVQINTIWGQGFTLVDRHQYLARKETA